ncbi:MAG: type II toxin-antitoxin system RelE/ParE family toxin [Alphaproteobacteria bacterium GM202ARS2]|nr:type II toxin-antitoxin system RelE/ParE family toxin [Alphaproteobacteria bacterium GM202ARS2]
MTEADRADVIDSFAANPEAGMSLGGGLRKVRIARTGGGKSGGYRVLHFYGEEGGGTFLLTAFAKNEWANIMPKEQAKLIALCGLIAVAYRRIR